MALAKGQSAIRLADLTMHTKTAIHIVELMTKVCVYLFTYPAAMPLTNDYYLTGKIYPRY